MATKAKSKKQKAGFSFSNALKTNGRLSTPKLLLAVVVVAVIGVVVLGNSFAAETTTWYYNSPGVRHNTGEYLRAYNLDGWDNHNTCAGSGDCGLMWYDPTLTFSTTKTTNVKVCVNAANEPGASGSLEMVVLFNNTDYQYFGVTRLTNTPTNYCQTYSRPTGANQTVAISVDGGGGAWVHSVSFTKDPVAGK